MAGHRTDRGWILRAVMRAIATASTGSVLPLPGRPNRSEVISAHVDHAHFPLEQVDGGRQP